MFSLKNPVLRFLSLLLAISVLSGSFLSCVFYSGGSVCATGRKDVLSILLINYVNFCEVSVPVKILE